LANRRLTGDTYRASLVVGAYNRDPGGKSTVVTVSAGQQFIVGFDHDVRHDPRKPYGIDLIVFGNSFFTAGSAVTPTSDWSNVSIAGGVNTEPLSVSVAQLSTGPWYTFSGRTGDGLFPTEAYGWDKKTSAWGPEQDFTKPVNPALTESDFVGKSAADGVALYDGSGGGAGFNLASSGFDWIRYVRFTGDGGEVDAVADVTPVPEPGMVGIGVLVGGVRLLGRRRAVS
jgi:hypothetical protein